MRIAACATVAVAGVAVATFAGGRVHAEQTRQPTRAELSTAAATAVAQRWERMPAGRLFPATIGYTTDLQTKETATRLGIDPRTACARALDGTLLRRAERDGCVAGLRAGYADQLGGSVYTLGILVFPDKAKASAFYAKVPVIGYPAAAAARHLHRLADRRPRERPGRHPRGDRGSAARPGPVRPGDPGRRGAGHRRL